MWSEHQVISWNSSVNRCAVFVLLLLLHCREVRYVLSMMPFYTYHRSFDCTIVEPLWTDDAGLRCKLQEIRRRRSIRRRRRLTCRRWLSVAQYCTITTPPACPTSLTPVCSGPSASAKRYSRNRRAINDPTITLSYSCATQSMTIIKIEYMHDSLLLWWGYNDNVIICCICC